MSITKQPMSRVFLAKSDDSQIKALYSGEDGERLAEAIRQNCNIWYPLKPGDVRHDK
ncbi:Clp protease [Escherichia coli]